MNTSEFPYNFVCEGNDVLRIGACNQVSSFAMNEL